MAKYIATIQDGEGNSVYPQTTTDGIIGLDKKIKGSVKDTGEVNNGITFLNGASDWGVKNSSGKKPFSTYRAVTVGDATIVFLTLEIANAKKMTSDGSVTVAQLPKSIISKGSHVWVSANSIRWTIGTDGKVQAFAEDHSIPANSRMRLRAVYIQ